VRHGPARRAPKPNYYTMLSYGRAVGVSDPEVSSLDLIHLAVAPDDHEPSD